MEEFVCFEGLGLPEIVELPLPLTMLPAGTDFSAGFSEEVETRSSNEDSTFKVVDNSKKLLDFSEEAYKESVMQLVPFKMWATRTFGIRANLRLLAIFWAFPPLGWRRRSSNSSKNYVPRGKRFSLKNIYKTQSLKER